MYFAQQGSKESHLLERNASDDGNDTSKNNYILALGTFTE